MKALIIDDVHEDLIPILEEVGVEVHYQPDIKANKVPEVISGYQILILRSKLNLDSTFLLKNKHLQIIGRSGAGMDNIDLEAAGKLGIHCVPANEGNRDAVGEHTVGLILSLLHRIVKSNSEIKDFVWDREGNRGEELGEKTVGIIGYGNMGKSVAQRLSGFGCRVIAYDKYLENYSDEFAEAVSMEEIYRETDILSLHIPLTEETLYMMNKEFIDAFRKPFYIINTSRGKITVLKEVEEKLKTGKILGAGLDVLENEKLSMLDGDEVEILRSLNSFDNVIITPHVAGWSKESYQKLSQVLGNKIACLLRKK